MAGSRATQTTVTPLILVALSVVALMTAMGKQGAMAQLSCTNALVSLSPCLNYITGNQTTPSQGCCSSLASVVKNNAPCLCQLLTGNNSLGIPINQTRALALPAECQVTTPPVSQCQSSGAPTTSPSLTASASGVPPSSPSTNGSGTPTTQATPSSNPTQNNSTSIIFISPVLNVATAVFLTAVVM